MLSLTYSDWIGLLGEFFFDNAHDGEEILFAVDESSLAEISGKGEEETSKSLSNAVEKVIGRGWRVSVVEELVRRWEINGRPTDHPALPFLALTVLAASRMGAFEGFAPHNFYVPLRRTLVEDDKEVDAPGSYLDYVRGLWASLENWANVVLDGRRGRLIVRNPGVHYGRGLAVQHALVKSYDLGQLDAFFRRIGLEPGEEVVPAELLRALKVWTAGRPEQWALRLHRICDDPDLAEYAQALLAREARRWDGRQRDPRTGRAVGRIRLGLDSLRRPSLGLFAQSDERLPAAINLRLESGHALELRRRDDWYHPVPLEELDVASIMRAGVELYGSGYRFTFRPESVYALAYDDDLGCWVSADRMSFGDRYHLVVRAELSEAVTRFCQSAGCEELRVDEAASRSLPVGWRLIVNVQFDSRPTMSPPACLASLIPVGAGPRLRLVGGLPLGAAHGVYLRGGEPFLALSSLCNDERLSITKESTGEIEQFRITALASRELPLSILQLEPDRYKITHGESSVSVTIVDGIADEAGPGAGTVFTRGRDGTKVRGSCVEGLGDRAEPWVVTAPPSGGSVFILGPAIEDVARITLPLWISDLAGPLSWRMIDAWPSFRPVWFLEKRAGGGFDATLLSPSDPMPNELAPESSWGRLLRLAQLRDNEGDDARDLWLRYQSVIGCPQ